MTAKRILVVDNEAKMRRILELSLRSLGHDVEQAGDGQAVYAERVRDAAGQLKVLQAEILRDYSQMVKPGGKLVYATCSVLPGENQHQVKAFLAAHGDEWKLEEEKTWTPNKQGFDGFYAARLVRAEKVDKKKPAEDTPAAA